GSGDRLTLPRRVDGAEWFRGRRILRGDHPEAERARLTVDVECAHVQDERAGALVREHVGQDQESPTGPVVHRCRRAVGLDIRTGIVDRYGVADVDLIRSARAVGPRSLA